MKETVKYNNEFNSLHLKSFTAMDLDMLMLLCAKLKECGDERIELGFTELKNQLGITNKSDKDLFGLLDRMNKKLNLVNCNFRTPTRSVWFVLFPTFDTDLEARVLRVCVNKDFAFLLNDLTKNFTRFEFEEFIRLESRYSKNLYRLLKQYRRTGTYKVDAGKFRDLMDCPKSYENKIFMRDCVNVAVKELSNGYFENLSVRPIRERKRGMPIVAYEFSFSPSKQVPGQMNIAGTDGMNQKKKNRFHNFAEREYNFSELERVLLG